MDKNKSLSNHRCPFKKYITLGKATININSFDLATTQKDGARFIKAINS